MNYITFHSKEWFNFDPQLVDWDRCDQLSTKVDLQDPTKGGLDDDPLQYEVCPKDVCLELVPELEKLMTEPLLMIGVNNCATPFVEKGTILEPMPGLLRAININTLRPGQKYQKHTDGNLVTVAIQLTECRGGNFEVFEVGGYVKSRKHFPHQFVGPGFGLIFPGGIYPHLVTPVESGISRMLLFSYGVPPTGIDRELEQQLYGR